MNDINDPKLNVRKDLDIKMIKVFIQIVIELINWVFVAKGDTT